MRNRKDIQVNTLKRIEKFLNDQTDFIYKTEIVQNIGVDYDSLNFALKMLEIETDGEGRIKIKK